MAEAHVDTWEQAVLAWAEAIAHNFEARVWDKRQERFVPTIVLHKASERLQLDGPLY